MADPSASVSYAEMVRRQAAEDVARWMSHQRAVGSTLGSNGLGGWAVYQLVGVFADQQDALHACDQPGRVAVAITANSPDALPAP